MNNLINKTIACALIVFFSPNVCNSQDDLGASAPTLQVGLEGFSFQKGSLDAQLIMEIIAEKQQDLKIKAIQNVFLSKVENAGGTVYTFVDNVVRELVFEADQNVRSKKILENTVNLVFVGAFLEFYIGRLDTTERLELITLYKKFNTYHNRTIQTQKLTSLETKERLSLADFTIGEYDVLARHANGANKITSGDSTMKFIALLFDMAGLSVKEDTKLQDLGLMQMSYSESYEFLNLYYQVQADTVLPLDTRWRWTAKTEKEKKAEHETRTGELAELKKSAKNLLTMMEEELTAVTSYIGFLNYMTKEGVFRLVETSDKEKALSLADWGNEVIDPKLDKLKTALEGLIKERQAVVLKKESNGNTKDTAIYGEIEKLTKFYYYVNRAKTINGDLSAYSDVMYTLTTDFIPAFTDHSYSSTAYLTVIGQLDSLNGIISSFIQFKNPKLQEYANKIPAFIELASTLYDFDKSTTISEYIGLLDDVADLFPDNDITSSLSTVISFIKDYSAIIETDGGDEVLSFNLESYLYKLQTIKPYAFRRFQWHFTVGQNHALFNETFALADASEVRNFSYVGEKIGLKYVIVERSFWMTRNPGETYKMYPSGATWTKITAPHEPILSNIHLLAYGSGILYNLVDINTNSEFNMPLMGAGLGFTFYNGLDLNFSLGVPIFPDQTINTDYYFLNFGLDIQFMEYYQRLNQKRKNNQSQKQISEAID